MCFSTFLVNKDDHSLLVSGYVWKVCIGCNSGDYLFIQGLYANFLISIMQILGVALATGKDSKPPKNSRLFHYHYICAKSVMSALLTMCSYYIFMFSLRYGTLLGIKIFILFII